MRSSFCRIGLLALALIVPIVGLTSGVSDPRAEAAYATTSSNLEAWALENNILSGYSDGTLKLDAPLTRSAAAAVLSRFATLEHTRGNENLGNCVSTVSDAQAKNICWLQANNLIADASAYDPTANTTRGAMATFLYRFMINLRQDALAVTCDSSYSDVPNANVHCKGIQWLKNTDLAAGLATKNATGNSYSYSPEKAITRGEAVDLLYRLNHQVRVATYNVRRACIQEDIDYNRSWQQRLDNVASGIRNASPDVVGLQEASDVKAAKDNVGNANTCIKVAKQDAQSTSLINKLSSDYVEVGTGIGGLHIFIKTSSIVQVGNLVTKDLLDADTYESGLYCAKSDGLCGDQYLLIASLKMKYSGRQFTAAVTHLLASGYDANYGSGHECNSIVTQQAQQAVAFLKPYNGSVFFFGDFNNPYTTGICTPHAKAITGNNGSTPVFSEAREMMPVTIDNKYVNESDKYATTLSKDKNGQWLLPTVKADPTVKYDRIYVRGASVISWVNQVQLAEPLASDHSLVYTTTLLTQ